MRKLNKAEKIAREIDKPIQERKTLFSFRLSKAKALKLIEAAKQQGLRVGTLIAKIVEESV